MGSISLSLVLWILVGLNPTFQAGQSTLSMDSETSCTKTHYYEAGDVYTVLAKGKVHDGHCHLTFLQSGSYRSEALDDPCFSVCVKIINYSMESCEVKMAYYDGLSDYTPVTFDCHTFPPVLWCSGKNDLKVSVSEQKNYHGKDYSIHLEVTPFCGNYKPSTDSGVVAHPKANSTSMSQVIMIIGSVVGTISIIFVLGWIMYCYKKRRGEPEMTGLQDRRSERMVRDTTPNQGTRYAPVDRNQASSQSSSDRGVGGNPYKINTDRGKPPLGINKLGEKRLYSPFQPPVPSNRGPGNQGTYYSDLDRGPGKGDKWYPMGHIGQTQQNVYTPTPISQPNQYLAQNQVYNYPQYNNTDGEMHTAPTDTRYVVYDFDFDQPVERKYSAGKSRRTPINDSPVKELERLRKREITPLRETVRVMPQIDSTTTDHTSDNDSSMSGTTEDETTTDDQLPTVRNYGMLPPYGFYGQMGAKKDSDTRLYDPRNFQRIDNRNARSADSAVPSVQSESIGKPRGDLMVNDSQNKSENNILGMQRPSQHDLDSSEGNTSVTKEGPMPQVPPIPKDFQRSQTRTPTGELPWPHSPPPPYSSDGPPPPYRSDVM